jgi:MFS family permease
MTSPTGTTSAGLSSLYTPQERNKIFFFAFIGTLLDGADFTIFLYYLAPLATYFHTTLVAIGAIQATSYVAGVIGGILFGSIADKWGRRWGLTLDVLMFSLFQVFAALSPNYYWLLVFRIFGGIAIGGESGLAYSYLNEALPSSTRRGLWAGLLQDMIIVGQFLAIALFVWANAFGVEGWRYSFSALGVGAVVALATRFMMPESKLWLMGKQSGVAKSRLPLRELCERKIAKRVILCTALMACVFYSAYGLQTYYFAMWQSVYKLPADVIGNIGYVVSFVVLISYTMGGYLADRLGRRGPFLIHSAIGMVLALCFIAIISFTPVAGVNASTIFVSPIFYPVALWGLAYGFLGAMGAWLGELFPTHIRSTAFNASYYIGRAIGGGIAPLLALMAATSMGLDVRFAIAFVIIGSIGTFLMTLTLPETRGIELKAD